MNQQNAREYMPLVQALANGLTIQKDSCGKWKDSEEIHFDMKPEFYRIKPEPRTFKIVVSRLSGSIHDAKEWHGNLPNDSDPQWEHVTVQEVLQ